MSDVCGDAVRSQHRDVAAALRHELGESFLFASLYATRGDVTYPLDGDELDDILNTDLDADKMEGMAWVQNGMEL